MAQNNGWWNLGDLKTVPCAPGVSKREWFAAQALPSVISCCAHDTRDDGETIEEMFARKAYGIADAMLAAEDSIAARLDQARAIGQSTR